MIYFVNKSIPQFNMITIVIIDYYHHYYTERIYVDLIGF